MRTGLFTVIKDEIEEDVIQWIEHHLSLGIDKIYIFEDYDSKKHDSLYGIDNVTVMNIQELVSHDEIRDYRENNHFKQTSKYSFQKLYMKKILGFLKNKLDWVGYIDVDEFLFPESDLKSILVDYKAYQVLIFYGRLYNANGHIKRPEGRIIDNYTQISPSDKFARTCKMFFNMNLFNDKMKYNQHIPISDCKFVNTDYTTKIGAMVFDRLYFRHYICKSWEDWKYKINRGQFNNSKRMDHFFLLNPEIDKKLLNLD